MPPSPAPPQPRSRRASSARSPPARSPRAPACPPSAPSPPTSTSPPPPSRPPSPSSAAAASSSPAPAAAPASPTARRCAPPTAPPASPPAPATSRSATPTRPSSPTSPPPSAALDEPPRPTWQRLYGEPPVDPGLAAVAARALAADGIPAERLDGGQRRAGRDRARARGAPLARGSASRSRIPGWPGVLDLVRALGLRLAPVAVDERGMRPGGAGAGAAGGRAGRGGHAARAQPARGGVRRRARRRAARAPARRARGRGRPPRAGGRRAVALGGRAERALGDGPLGLQMARARTCAARSSPATSSRSPASRGGCRSGPGWVSGRAAAADRTPVGRPGRRGARRAGERGLRRRAGPRSSTRSPRTACRAYAPSGLNVWIPVPDEDAAVRALLAAGVSVAAGAPFRLETPPAVRITAATLEPGEAPAIAAALAGAVEPAPAHAGCVGSAG